jgi:hypothetical protein
VIVPRTGPLGVTLRSVGSKPTDMTETGQGSDSTGGQPESGSRTSIWEELHLDDVTKILILSGGLLYGIQFMAYRTYYDALNLSPEDVGVDTAYILVRSPGFVFLTLSFILYAGMSTALGTLGLKYGLKYLLRENAIPGLGRKPDGSRRRVAPGAVIALITGSLIGVALITALSFWISTNYPRRTLPSFYLGGESTGSTIAMLAIGSASLAILWIGRRKRILPLRYLVAIALGILIIGGMTTLLLDQAQIRGQKAADGEVVEPLQFLGFVVLDVSSPKVNAMWSDPKTPYLPYILEPGRRHSPSQARLSVKLPPPLSWP